MPETQAKQVSQEEILKYKSDVEVIWCPGCGDYGALNALYKALALLGLDPKDVVVVSGIGCSGRLSIFTTCYGFHGIHGRVLPTAMGVKLANPKLTVIAVGGDGDGLAIGAGHFPHACRRNIDITYILLDNSTYGLTKGQASPTTTEEFHVRSLPYGVVEEPLNPVGFALACGASFVARGYTARPHEVVDLYCEAIRHKGFAFIHEISPCVVFNNTFSYYNKKVVPIPPEHDPSNRDAAIHLWRDPGKIYTGIFYRDNRMGMVERIAHVQEAAVKKYGPGTVDGLFSEFL